MYSNPKDWIFISEQHVARVFCGVLLPAWRDMATGCIIKYKYIVLSVLYTAICVPFTKIYYYDIIS